VTAGKENQMLRLLARKFILLLLLIPVLHVVGFFYATTHPHLHSGPPAGPATPSYTAYLAQVLAGNLGRVGPLPIAEIVGAGIRNSLVLLALALVVTASAGPALGYLSISRRTRRLTPLALMVTAAGASLPGFFLGVAIIALMIYGIFSLTRGKTPLPLSGYGLDEHLILPVLVLAAGPALQVARVTAGMLENELHQEYVRVAQSKGLDWPHIYRRHAFPNIVSAVALTIGRSVRLLISGLIVVEALFLWPGIGRIFTYAVGIRIDGREPLEYFLHPQLTATLAVVFGVGLLLADLAANLIAFGTDPRLRAPAEGRSRA
jgi:peptide/nickel transport system permease protein